MFILYTIDPTTALAGLPSDNNALAEATTTYKREAMGAYYYNRVRKEEKRSNQLTMMSEQRKADLLKPTKKELKQIQKLESEKALVKDQKDVDRLNRQINSIKARGKQRVVRDFNRKGWFRPSLADMSRESHRIETTLANYKSWSLKTNPNLRDLSNDFTGHNDAYYKNIAMTQIRKQYDDEYMVGQSQRQTVSMDATTATTAA